MPLDTAATLALGSILFIWGGRFGRSLLHHGITADDLFKGKNPLSLAFLGCYVCVMVLILNVPQMDIFPLEWRFYGMHITWSLMHIILAGVCGAAIAISWQTARHQVITVALLGLIGIASFSGFEHYLLSPIHTQLHDNLRPNGVYKQTSNSSCAPAAMATILHRWGMDVPESEVAELAGTSRMGTSMPQLILAAQALNMDGLELHPTWELMQQINRPGILAVWVFDENGRRLPHAVALLGLDAHTAIIADPAAGDLFRLTRQEFLKIWRNEYVPIFPPGDTLIGTLEAAHYLQKLGYFPSPEQVQHLSPILRKFQIDHQLKQNGKLDPATALALSGEFLEDVPRLDAFYEPMSIL